MKSEITLRSSHSNERRGCFLTSWKAAEVEMNSTRGCSGVRAPLPQKISPVKPEYYSPGQMSLTDRDYSLTRNVPQNPNLPRTGSGRETLNSGQATTRLTVWLFPSPSSCCCFWRLISSTPLPPRLGTISSIEVVIFFSDKSFTQKESSCSEQ